MGILILIFLGVEFNCSEKLKRFGKHILPLIQVEEIYLVKS